MSFKNSYFWEIKNNIKNRQENTVYSSPPYYFVLSKGIFHTFFDKKESLQKTLSTAKILQILWHAKIIA